MLGLGYPGGPAIEAAALDGRAEGFDLPRPMTGRQGCDLSFSGLKTALRRIVETLGTMTPRRRADLAASFQAAIADCLADRMDHACEIYRQRYPSADPLPMVVAGGVAANRFLAQRLEKTAAAHDGRLIVPPRPLCTDNAAMIAWAGIERLRSKDPGWGGDSLDTSARPRWPLESLDM